MNESIRFIINKYTMLHFNHVRDVFEIIANAQIPNPPYTSTNLYAKIWEVGMEEAGLIVGLIRDSLEDRSSAKHKHIFMPDRKVFSVRKISDTVFSLHISTSEIENTTFWAHITSEQVKELQTIMQRIYDTLAKGQE